jgi:hypothetical protein
MVVRARVVLLSLCLAVPGAAGFGRTQEAGLPAAAATEIDYQTSTTSTFPDSRAASRRF